MPGNPVNLAGTMPPEALNGWFTMLHDLLAQPDRMRIIVGICDVDKISHKVSTGADTPVVQLRHVEVASLGDTETCEQLAAILRNLQRKRLGDQQLELTYQPGAVAPPPEPKVAAGDED
jgi:hypothetical protein